MKKSFLFLFFVSLFTTVYSQHYTFVKSGRLQLTEQGAVHFSALAMKCIVQEFPNKTGHIQVDENDLKQPSEYHPAFYGCYDWHSAVHGHWMLVKLLKSFPNLPNAESIRNAINRNITTENIKIELAYFDRKFVGAYERTYGWAWLLKLSDELHSWDDADGKRWAKALAPLEKLIAEKFISYLPLQEYANRTGTHNNTAFALSLALDYAKNVQHKKLEEVVSERAKFYFETDRDCPVSWEPNASDFFSPCLLEAELMLKVLPKTLLEAWLKDFLPALAQGNVEELFSPVRVTDRNDMQLVHLDGLNLSRAWCLFSIADNIESEFVQEQMRKVAINHLKATVPQIADGDYAGEHWLASFAVYALLN